jgi:hypothetical protein
MGLDLGTVPAWLGAGSLFLAYRVFLHDRTNLDRSQVDRVGAWWETRHYRGFPGVEDDVANSEKNIVDVTIFVRNASDLPVEMSQIGYDIETTWLISEGRLAYSESPGIKPYRAFVRRTLLAPQSTKEIPGKFDVSDLAPEGGVQLSPIEGASIRIRWLLVIDTAGRRWILKPGSGERARQARWYMQPEEYQPRDWFPTRRSKWWRRRLR